MTVYLIFDVTGVIEVVDSEDKAKEICDALDAVSIVLGDDNYHAYKAYDVY